MTTMDLHGFCTLNQTRKYRFRYRNSVQKVQIQMLYHSFPLIKQYIFCRFNVLMSLDSDVVFWWFIWAGIYAVGYEFRVNVDYIF